jgi:DNA-binding CsgD family transcriptional regulator
MRDPSTLLQLTPQEVRWRALSRGPAHREVVAQLFLSTSTVDFHLRNVFTKLGISSRTGLARLPWDDRGISPATWHLLATREGSSPSVATMTSQSRRVAGIVLIVFPTVVFGGVSVLTLLVHDPTYADNAIRQNLWRAGHAHAGVLLLLTLVVLRYVDETGLSEGTRWYVRLAVPAAAVLLPIAFFLSVLSPDATQPTPLVYIAYVGAALLVTGLLILGIGLLRARGPAVDGGGERGAVAAEGH